MSHAAILAAGGVLIATETYTRPEFAFRRVSRKTYRMPDGSRMYGLERPA